MQTLGLYIHIPFCKAKCAYCDFYSLPACTEDRMDAYTAALCRHLTHFAPRLRETVKAPERRYTVDTVYFGGGTPSCLGARRLLEIWDTVVRDYPLSPDAEVTVEANPESCGDWLSTLRANRFNRVSLGMQSACDRELGEIGRIHTAADTRSAVETVRRAGFDNLSLDLIYGLPRQSMDRWQANVRAAIDLGPEHLSCYGLKVEEGTPLSTRRDTEDLPDEEAQAELYLRAVEELDRAGYRQYEISNFARPGRASRHNLKYWTLSPYIGFGPGAHSDFGGVRYAWVRDLDSYIRAFTGEADNLPKANSQTDSQTVEQSHIPGQTGSLDGAERELLAEYTPIDRTERTREWVMLGLRTAAGLDAAAYGQRFGSLAGESAIPDFDRFVPFLEQCKAAGYAVHSGNRWRLTPRGFLVSNQIIGGLLDWWE